VAEGLRRAVGAFRPEFSAGLSAIVATSVELQARAALKEVGMTAAMAEALAKRGVAEPAAQLAAEIGGLALKQGFAAWVAGDTSQDLGELMYAELDRLRPTAARP
jgi:hypothetical protein